MHKLLTRLCAALALLTTASCSTNKSEKLLLGGSGWNKIAIVDKDTKQIEWEHPIEKGWECNSAVVTPDGNILFSYGKGAKLIPRDHQEIWDIPVPVNSEMPTARILPDGNYLLAWAGHPAVILEVNPQGKVLKQTAYETGIENPHAQFRQVNKKANGNYLMPLFATSDVREISPAGEAVKIVRLEGTPFTTLQNEGDNYWVAAGDGHSLLEVNMENGEIVRRFGENDFDKTKLFFVAGLTPSTDGGLYVCNWQGHDDNARAANSPQLFEIDNDGNVVWSLNDNDSFGMISTVCVVD